jgi:hypothetical protein
LIQFKGTEAAEPRRDTSGLNISNDGRSGPRVFALAARLPPSVLPLKLIVTNEEAESLCEEEI